MLEATCRKCDETFIPADTQDTVHIVKEDGSFCGGTGDIEGEYQPILEPQMSYIFGLLPMPSEPLLWMGDNS